MGKYGKVFKMIRESKNMSLKEVAGDFVTPAQLSRFENGKSNLSVDTFFNCLENMDVLQGEFSTFYHSYYQNEDLRISVEWDRALETHNVAFFQKKIEEYKNRVSQYNRKSDRVLISVFHVMISKCDSSYLIPELEKQVITDYLMSIDEWCSYELWIFGNCSRVFNTKTLDILGNEVIHRTQFFKGIPENKRRIYKILLNATGTLLDRKEERIAAKFIRFIDSLEIFETDTFERMQLKFLKANLSYLQGDVKGLEDMKECQKFMDFLDCHRVSKQIEDTIALFTDM